ncbi:MAG: OsmC family protein, partial [Gemmatimonadota bacterium]|nr:OsmC family protein [Gemmatimonadota bacterium]
MKITILADDRLRVDAVPGPMTVEAPSAELRYSPFHMLASGLATCVYATLASWAENAKIDAAELAIEVGWSFAEKPHRVGSFSLRLEWPGLPPERHAAAERVTHLCPIHATLGNPPEIRTEIAAEA